MGAGPLILLTGATGLLGAATLERLLSRHRSARVAVLVRSSDRWGMIAARLGPAAQRVEPLLGDITSDGLGLGPPTRRGLCARMRAVVHLAADTTFSHPLADARLVNTRGTLNVLALADECRAEHVVHVSTAFVAGTLTGFVQDDTAHATAWVNGYERSKFEAEAVVRQQRVPWTILRPSTIVCDDVTGRVSQVNAVHRALRLCRAGLASMLPGAEETPVDVVPTSWVADAVARTTGRADLRERSIHLCAGSAAMPLGELLNRTWEHWSLTPEWNRRTLSPPALTDLATYRLFEDAVRESADPRLARVVDALSNFVPQLAFPKHFDTAGARAIADLPAPPPSTYWTAMLDHLDAAGWAVPRRSVA